MQAITPNRNLSLFMHIFFVFLEGKGFGRSIAVGCSVLVVLFLLSHHFPTTNAKIIIIITRAELTIGFLTWQCLVASRWPGTSCVKEMWKSVCVCVRTCVSMRGKRCECVKWAGWFFFVSSKQEFCFFVFCFPPKSQVSFRWVFSPRSLYNQRVSSLVRGVTVHSSCLCVKL